MGSQRIHQKPVRAEIVACKCWLTAEVEQVQPQVIVCLGADPLRREGMKQALKADLARAKALIGT